ARNIELLHESGNSNKRDRDGNRVQNRGHGQQEIRGSYDQGQHMYRGRQDRDYDSKRQDFRGQDQRLPPTTGRIYATTCGQAAKTSGLRYLVTFANLNSFITVPHRLSPLSSSLL
nr:zinc finger, CCHC-type, retrotransposon Gag domain protein [Tanacetum cinerariifolium]